MTSAAAGNTSNMRCANTEPIRVAVAPRRPGSRRRSTATRASSPTRPGRTAFANSPTENAENTSGKPRPGRLERLPDRRVPGERASDHGQEVEPDRRDHPSPLDDGEGVVHEVPVGPAVEEECDRGGDQGQHEQRAPAAVPQHQATTSS